MHWSGRASFGSAPAVQHHFSVLEICFNDRYLSVVISPLFVHLISASSRVYMCQPLNSPSKLFHFSSNLVHKDNANSLELASSGSIPNTVSPPILSSHTPLTPLHASAPAYEERVIYVYSFLLKQMGRGCRTAIWDESTVSDFH
jgi:hypothetical protein